MARLAVLSSGKYVVCSGGMGRGDCVAEDVCDSVEPTASSSGFAIRNPPRVSLSDKSPFIVCAVVAVCSKAVIWVFVAQSNCAWLALATSHVLFKLFLLCWR